MTRLLHSNVLDPRPAAAAAGEPVWGAVNVPADEIGSRTHELPQKGMGLRVVDFGECSDRAIEVLSARGRGAERVEPKTVWGEAGCGYRLWSPNAFLEEQIATVAPGRVLDLACGTGRDAVFLAGLGRAVTAVDWLPDGLERGRDLERRYARSNPIEWIEADLRSWRTDEPFALATMFFWLNRPLLQATRAEEVMVEAFTPTHRERFGKPGSGELVTTLEELVSLFPGHETVRGEEGWGPKGHTARYHGRQREESI